MAPASAVPCTHSGAEALDHDACREPHDATVQRSVLVGKTRGTAEPLEERGKELLYIYIEPAFSKLHGFLSLQAEAWGPSENCFIEKERETPGPQEERGPRKKCSGRETKCAVFKM